MPSERALPSFARRIAAVPGFPRKGILFRDIMPMLRDADAFHEAMGELEEAVSVPEEITHVVGIEARGFILGAALAGRLRAGFVPVRKAGKLPRAVETRDYSLEYGTASVEIQQDALDASSTVLLVDDLLATGGTAEAAASLIESCGARLSQCLFLVELPALAGRERISRFPVTALISYDE